MKSKGSEKCKCVHKVHLPSKGNDKCKGVQRIKNVQWKGNEQLMLFNSKRNEQLLKITKKSKLSKSFKPRSKNLKLRLRRLVTRGKSFSFRMCQDPVSLTTEIQ